MKEGKERKEKEEEKTREQQRELKRGENIERTLGREKQKE